MPRIVVDFPEEMSPIDALIYAAEMVSLEEPMRVGRVSVEIVEDRGIKTGEGKSSKSLWRRCTLGLVGRTECVGRTGSHPDAAKGSNFPCIM